MVSLLMQGSAWAAEGKCLGQQQGRGWWSRIGLCSLMSTAIMQCKAEQEKDQTCEVGETHSHKPITTTTTPTNPLLPLLLPQTHYHYCNSHKPITITPLQ